MPDQHPDVLSAVEASLRQHYEVVPARASVSFLGVEPIEVLRYRDDGLSHYVSLGMSRHPMTDPSAVLVDDATGPRAELLISVAGQPDEIWRKLAILAAAPAVEGAVYEIGNRVDLSEPLCPGSRCTGAIIEPGPLEPIAVPGGADVEILRLIPATATELAWARVHGSAALGERWREYNIDLADLSRAPVDLT
ncbi:suppressor of fused domain protein [Jatrophihabitans sp. DSM 45814]